MHFPYLGNTTNRLEFKFGFGLGTTNTKVKGRQESFDQQYFSSGGIGFVIDLNPQDSGQLDTYYSDYWWTYDQVVCLMAPGEEVWYFCWVGYGSGVFTAWLLRGGELGKR
jgi:hypothetical protein